MTARRRGRALRVGLVCPYSFEAPGGVQNHVLGLARHLREQGHEPYVLAPGTLDGLAPGTIESERFTSAGTAVPVRYNGSVARVNFGPLSAARVRRWLRAGRFDLLHIHEPITPSISLLALWAAESPVVATFHTATPRSRSMQIAGGVLRPAIEKIDAGIAVSESAREVVVRHLGRDAVVIPNGIRCADFGAADPGRPTVRGPPAALPRPGRRATQGSGRARSAAAAAIRRVVPDLEMVVAGQGTRPLPAGLRRRRHHHRRGEGRPARLRGLLRRSASRPGELRHRGARGDGQRDAGGGVRHRRLLRPAAHRPDRRMLGELFAEGDPAALAEAAIRMLNQPDPGRTAAARRAAQHYDWSRVGGGSSRSTAPRWRPWNRPVSPAPHHDHLVDHLGPGDHLVDHRLAAVLARHPGRSGECAHRVHLGRPRRRTGPAGATRGRAGAAPGVDPASALLVSDAAAAALEPDLSHHDRERAESDLSHVLEVVGPGISEIAG